MERLETQSSRLPVQNITLREIIAEDRHRQKRSPEEIGLALSLIEKYASYHPEDLAGFREIERACDLLFYSLQGEKRESGLPASTHSLEVAHLLADKKLDRETIITGVIHDLVEDTKIYPKDKTDRIINIDHIRSLFGETIAGMTEDLIKVKGRRNQDLTPQTHFKMFEALFHDPRAIFVKLADRLHNMRTIEGLKSRTKRKRKAMETLKVYIPLAKKLGLFDWGEELADHSFRTLYPKTYEPLKRQFDEWKSNIDLGEFGVLVEQGLTVGPKPVAIHVSYPSIYRHYRGEGNSLYGITPERFVPVVAVVLGSNPRTEAVRASEIMSRISWAGQVMDSFNSLNNFGHFPEDAAQALSEMLKEGSPNIELPFEIDNKKMVIRFMTPGDRESQETGLLDYYHQDSPLHQEAITKIEELKRNLQRVGSTKAGVEEFVQNLEANLVTVKVNGIDRTFPAGATLLDVAMDIYDARQAEKIIKVKVTREGVPFEVGELGHLNAIAEQDEIDFQEFGFGDQNILTPDSLDLVETPYARREISRILLEKMITEKDLPYRKREITQMAKRRGVEKLEELFQSETHERGYQQNDLFIRIDAAYKVIAREMSILSDPLSKRKIKYSAVDRLLILLGVDYLNFDTERNRRLLTKVVEGLMEIQYSRIPVHIKVADLKGAVREISTVLARDDMFIWAIDSRPDQNEPRRQQISLMLSPEDVQRFQEKILPRLKKIRMREKMRIGKNGGKERFRKRKLVYDVAVHPSVFEEQKELKAEA